MSVASRLAALGITLPTPSAPLQNYVPWVRTGTLVVISGQLPLLDGTLAYTGPADDTAVQAARLCMINVLAQLNVACEGDLERVRQVVRLGGYFAAPPSYTEHAVAMNGASDLAVAVFADRGRHARSTIGVPSLPRNAMAEVDGWFELA